MVRRTVYEEGERTFHTTCDTARLTLSVVADLAVDTRRRKLDLVGEDTARRGSPIRDQAVVAGNPLGGDIRIHLDAVRVAIVGLDGNGKVREGKRLVDKVRRLCRGD